MGTQRPHSNMSGGRHNLSSASSRGSQNSANGVDSSHVRLFLKRGSQSSYTSMEQISSRPQSNTSFTDYTKHTLTTSTSSGTPETSTDGHLSQGRSKLIVTPNNPNGGRPVPPAMNNRRLTDPSMKRPKSHYVGEVVFQLDDFAYVGGIESANNANLLCRLNIEYVIDVSNITQADLPRSKRSDCPCLCSKETQHSRATLTVDVNTNSTGTLIDNFAAANNFIEKAKAHGKCALIHSYDGRNRAAVFAVQYLMDKHSIGLVRAEQLCRDIIPKMRISDNFYGSLRRWESVIANRNGRNTVVVQMNQRTNRFLTSGGAATGPQTLADRQQTDRQQTMDRQGADRPQMGGGGEWMMTGPPPPPNRQSAGQAFLMNFGRQAKNAWI